MGKGSFSSSGDTYVLNDNPSDAKTDEFGFYINGHSPEKVARITPDYELYSSISEMANDYEGGLSAVAAHEPVEWY